jgi:PIN domain nuclease of toxin-antitoxin system
MKILLDTHVLLWWLDDPLQISSETASVIRNQNNNIYVSAVSVWEIVIKKALGKLIAPDNLDEVIQHCHFTPLPITIEHALAIRNLPRHHFDPFDRMIVAQAMIEDMTIVTRDTNIFRYGVPYLMA